MLDNRRRRWRRHWSGSAEIVPPHPTTSCLMMHSTCCLMHSASLPTSLFHASPQYHITFGLSQSFCVKVKFHTGLNQPQSLYKIPEGSGKSRSRTKSNNNQFLLLDHSLPQWLGWTDLGITLETSNTCSSPAKLIHSWKYGLCQCGRTLSVSDVCSSTCLIQDLSMHEDDSISFCTAAILSLIDPKYCLQTCLLC